MKITKVIGDENSPACIRLEDEQGGWSADVKFDGCIHFNRHYDSTDSDYIHICDVDEMIKTLQDIKQKALDTFGDQWPK